MPTSLKTSSLTLLLLLTLFSSALKAQDKLNIRFGKVSPEDFQINSAQVDTSYGGVIIADVGNSSFQGNQKGGFSLLFNHYRRVKIINKKGYSLGDFEIPLYRGFDGNEEKITSFRATTYTLENGKIVETKMPKDAKFTDKLNDHIVVKKFSFPNVKDGCILEYSYTVTSDYFGNFQPWTFQGAYPRLWSEYEAEIPEYFIYDIQAQGYLPFSINKTSSSVNDYHINVSDNFSHPEILNLTSNNADHRWVIKDVPALKEEKFISSTENFVSKIEFQLSGIRFPNSPYHDYRGDWRVTAEKLLQRSSFGADLNRENSWMNEEISALHNSTQKLLEKAMAVYNYVQSHLKWNRFNSYDMDQSLKETFTKKSGNVADINLLLVAMMRHEKIKADPVILSTRSHGLVSQLYPLEDRYNYALCRVTIDSDQYLLDASKNYLGFGNIPAECYNGQAKVIMENPENLDLSADKVKNVQITNIQLMNSGNNPGNWVGNFTSTLGEFTSNNVRYTILEKGKTEFIKKIKDSYKGETTVDSLDLVDENVLSKPITVNYKIKIKSEDNSNIIYLNPMMSEGYKENPFKSAERLYPVEMPYASDEIYSFQVQIPKGYKVDEVPKSARVNLNDNYGYFEFLLSVDENSVALRSRIKLNKANFSAEDYETLRNFYDLIVKKHAEQIVFKKI